MGTGLQGANWAELLLCLLERVSKLSRRHCAMARIDFIINGTYQRGIDGHIWSFRFAK